MRTKSNRWHSVFAKMKIHPLRLPALVLACVSFLAAQPIAARFLDDTQAKQVIIFGRHGVRTPVLPNSSLNAYSVLLFPVFPNVPGGPPLGVSVITPSGAMDETILGGYFRAWLIEEGLLTTNDTANANLVYFRANDVPLITDTAKAFWTGMLPGAPVNVDSYTAPANDPLFSPLAAGVAEVDYQKAIASVNGRLGNNPEALATAYAPELALTRSILFNYPVNENPPPAATKPDVTDLISNPITVTTGNTAQPVNLGSLANIIPATDPFVMEYADGLATADVGWGQLTLEGNTQINRLYNLVLDLEYRTPYLAQVQSSNVASHIARSLVQAATGNPMPGTLATPTAQVIVLIAANTNITGLAGLLHLDWLLPGYEQDVSAPSGALVLELRQSQSTGEYIVRTSYVSQTMDQLRNQTPLTLDAPPAIAPVFVPGCSIDNATFDCPLGKFVSVASELIDQYSADLVELADRT
jgi:4-phytase/acid phosphatase